MMSTLRNLGVDWRDRRMIAELYMNQEAVVRIADDVSDPGIIGRGVRQGCPISPLLFSIYAEAMMAEALEEVKEGIRVGGELLKDVRFADDQGMIVGSNDGLQRLMESLNRAAGRYDMKINIKKTKTMVVSRKGGGIVDIQLDGKKVEQVKKFRYLGSMISEDGRCIDDVKSRIGMAKDAFHKTKELLTKSLSKSIKKRMMKSLIWPVALYGCETWTMRKEESDRLAAFEMWIWRRMEKVSWNDKKTNEEILTLVEEERCMLEVIAKRKKAWIGHVLRGDGLLKLVIEGRMEGKRPRGRPRIGMMDDIMMGSYGDMKRMALDRDSWRVWVPRTCHVAEN